MGTTAVVSALAGLLGGIATSVTMVALLYRRLAVMIAEERATRTAVAELTEAVRDPDQWWFWTPQWQAGEREADADLVAGRSMHFDTEEEFESYLEQVPQRQSASVP